MIISFSVVGLIRSSSAARFCTPPAASSVDSMSRFSTLVMTSLKEMPSGGTTNFGIWNDGADRTWSGIRSAPIRRLELSTTARSITFSSSRTLPGQSYSIIRSSAVAVSSIPGLLFSAQYFSRK